LIKICNRKPWWFWALSWSFQDFWRCL